MQQKKSEKVYAAKYYISVIVIIFHLLVFNPGINF